MADEMTTATTVQDWKPDVVLYHGHCDDGFASAWACWKRWGDGIQYVPMQYGGALPDIAGKNVLMVDFSLKREAMIDAGSLARSIVVLDHHKTAEQELSGFAQTAKVPEPMDIPVHLANAGEPDADPYDRVLVHFDMDKSGARLAWELCHPGKPMPRLLEHIEDRDLWRFRLHETKAVSAAVRSYDYDFAVWDVWAASDLMLSVLVGQGNAILRAQGRHVADFLEQSYMAEVAGCTVPCLNVPYAYASDCGHALLKKYPDAPFAATWWRLREGRIGWSLRSEDSREDVGAIAERMGGGGHRNASGFSATAITPIAHMGSAAGATP